MIIIVTIFACLLSGTLAGYIIGCVLSYQGYDKKMREFIKKGLMFYDGKIYRLNQIKGEEILDSYSIVI